PTELYVKRSLKLFSSDDIKACAHITGGGLIENLPRGIDEKSVRIVLERRKVKTHPLMQKFVEAAGLEEREAFSTWNMGIGFCMIAPDRCASLLTREGAIEIGRVESAQSGKESVILE